MACRNTNICLLPIHAGIPLKLLHEAEGHVVTCELNTGEMYRGAFLFFLAPLFAVHARRVEDTVCDRVGRASVRTVRQRHAAVVQNCIAAAPRDFDAWMLVASFCAQEDTLVWVRMHTEP